MALLRSTPSRSRLPLLAVAVGLWAGAACLGGESVDTGFDDLGGGAGGTWGVGGSSSTSTGSGTSTGTGTGADTSTGTSTGTETGTGTGTGGTGGCSDSGPGEPNNDNEASALDLGDVDDDDADGGSVPGFIFDGDQDWFVYFGIDNFPGVAEPTCSFSSSDTLRVCQFIQCPDNDENFDCPGGTVDENSPEGRIGCCGTVGFAIDSFQCGSSSLNNDSATIYLRVDDPAGLATCTSYTLDYHF